MKKIVVILIVGLYIGSIFLVNFFGLQYVPHEMEVFVKKIECNAIADLSGKEIPYYQTTQDQESQKEKKWFKIKFVEGDYDENNLANNPNTFKIVCSVLPDNASNKTVTFSYEEKPTKYIVDEEQMTVTFLRRGAIDITIISTDGSNIQEMIVIEALKII